MQPNHAIEPFQEPVGFDFPRYDQSDPTGS